MPYTMEQWRLVNLHHKTIDMMMSEADFLLLQSMTTLITGSPLMLFNSVCWGDEELLKCDSKQRDS